MTASLFPRTFDHDWRIPFLGGRPERTHAIDADDLANLRIALGLHHDVLELCGDPHLFTRLGLGRGMPADIALRHMRR
mgnify:CR=1 FL=1